MARARRATTKETRRFLIDHPRGSLPPPVCEVATEDGVLLSAGNPGLVAVRVSPGALAVAIFGIR